MVRYKEKGINSYRFKFVLQERKARGSNRGTYTMKLIIDSPIWHYHIHVLKKNILSSMAIRFSMMNCTETDYDIKLVTRPNPPKIFRPKKFNEKGKKRIPSEREKEFANIFNDILSRQLRRFERYNQQARRRGRIKQLSRADEHDLYRNMLLKLSYFVNLQLTDFLTLLYGQPKISNKHYNKNNHICKTTIDMIQTTWETDLTLAQIQQLSGRILGIKLDFSNNASLSTRDMLGII